MVRDWLFGVRRYFLYAGASLLLAAGVAGAQDQEAELRALIERQGRLIEEQGMQIETLRQRLENIGPAGPSFPATLTNIPPSIPSVPSALPENPGAGNAQSRELKSRIDRLERQNQELLDALRRLQATPTSPAPGSGDAGPFLPGDTASVEASARRGSILGADDVRKLVGDYLQSREQKQKADDEAKKAEDREKGFIVGKSLGLTGRWDYGPWLESADKAFRVHFSGRTQFDTVGSWAPDNVQFADPGGIGSFLDAVNFRRARLQIDGWFYEVIDFYCEYDFLNTFDTGKTVNTEDDFGGRISNVPVPTDLWIGINYLPFIRTLRAGNMKPPIGFEHITSSRYLNFMERSEQFDAFIENGNNGFTQGFQTLNWTEDERMTYQLGIFKNTRSIMGWNVGDGEWMYVGRVTWLPWYQDDGRYMVHLGMGAEWANLDDGNTRFRARTEIRNGPAALHNIVAIARMDGDNQIILNPEFYMNLGPFSIQAEYNPVWVNNVDRIIVTPTQKDVKISPRQYFAQGAYVEALYFLTGENRQYVKTPVHTNGASTARVIPYRNYFWVPGQGVTNPFSCGAWQVGVRYSYLDLNNNGILGGQLNDVTLGLNWYLNPNFKVQWNYSHGWRHIPDSDASGPYQQVGMRFAFDW